ncbi:hydrogenase expression protein [Haladaptatus sp. W1]|uniref:AIR synthase family protein n=1 Tax=Haladaptatus sp. W1 TaxID=1897478 RepID=UPI000849C8D8|nr:AIR synthase family protein [Haladaptatus sp. W1]ODR79623.1 hydrogenase expression protein [Haladaptatus sp. W1]
MSDIGKIDRDFFDEHIYPYLGADRDDELLGPKHGVDFGVIELDTHVVALATDPLSLLPELGFERAAWFAFHVVMSDVAVSGLRPSHLAVDFNLPPEISDEEFATVWQTFDREARKLGVSVVTGHTARYSGCQYPWVGGATTLAVGEKENLVRPDGAQSGDKVLVTKGPGVETAGFLVTLFEDQINLPEDDIKNAKDRFYDMSPVEDALVAADAGPVTAMHDATECGIHGALVEMARSAGVRFDVSHDDVPVLPGVLEACEYFDVDPWESTTEGTLVLTVASEGAETVLAALSDAGIPAAEMGTVREGEGVYVDGDRIEHPDVDPSLQVFAELSAERE